MPDGKRSDIFSVDNFITAIAAAENDRIYLGDSSGSVFSINLPNNTKLWQRRIGGARISDIEITAHGLLVSSYDNFVYMLSAESGKRLWKRRLNGRISSKPAVSGRYAVVISLFDSSAAIIELKQGKIVNRIYLERENFFTGGVLFTGNRVVFTTSNGLKTFAVSPTQC